MLNTTIRAWLDSVEGEKGHYFLNIKRKGKQIYYGYSENVPEKIKDYVIDTVYADFPDDGFGMKVL